MLWFILGIQLMIVAPALGDEEEIEATLEISEDEECEEYGEFDD